MTNTDQQKLSECRGSIAVSASVLEGVLNYEGGRLSPNCMLDLRHVVESLRETSSNLVQIGSEG